MNFSDQLDDLIELVRKAKTVPLSSSIMLNRADIIDRLVALKEALPQEIQDARWVTRDREEVLERARKGAEAMLAEARGQQERLVSATEVVQASSREGSKILEEAKERSREIQAEAEDYVDAKLANFEIVLQRVLASVGKGRQRLRERLEGPMGALDEGDDDESATS